MSVMCFKMVVFYKHKPVFIYLPPVHRPALQEAFRGNLNRTCSPVHLSKNKTIQRLLTPLEFDVVSVEDIFQYRREILKYHICFQG